MKKVYILFYLIICPIVVFGFINMSYGATVGNSLDIDVPTTSAVLRQEIINNTLDEYEQIVKIKAALDLEFVFNKELSAPVEVENAEISGQWCMAKLGVTLFNRVEPYIKFGLSDLEAKWRQNSVWDMEVDADLGFAWGGGIKGVIFDFDPLGIRLTGDAQYRITEPDVSECSVDGTGITDEGADFNIEEWQASLILSKKFELPLRWQNVYMVPYVGATVSDSLVDVEFNDADAPSVTGAADYSLFDASNDSSYGFVFGCDIMPTLTSYFIYSFEVRLVDETAVTLGGAMKF